MIGLQSMDHWRTIILGEAQVHGNAVHDAVDMVNKGLYHR